MRIFLIVFIFFVFGVNQNVYSQCSIDVDTANITHIACPNGGAVGAAQIIQSSYLFYSWENITNGQLYNGGTGTGGPSRTDLDAGFYRILGFTTLNPSCPNTIYSDTFEIKMPTVNVQPNPNQACPIPNQCDVSTSISLTNTVASNIYSWKVDNLPQNTINSSFSNLCGGSHTYEVFANLQSCGIENFSISQLAPINLSTSVTNVTCTQSGSANVSIAGGGASSLNNYCSSSPQFADYSTIYNVSLIGDNNSITNNTSGICNKYSDFTAQLADVTPGNIYTLDVELGICNSVGWTSDDIANIYIDWNIDGDFDDVNENIATIPPTQSPSNHSINFTVPANAVPGQSRMRIVMQNHSGQTLNQAGPCSNNIAWYGETEDYTIIVSGSVVPPVTYLWNDGQTTQTATNLLAGRYDVTITDANGCIVRDTAVVGGSSNPIPTVTISAVPNPACEGDDIVLTAVASTGSNYEYKFMYNDGTGWSGNSVTTPPWDINNSVIYNNITQSTDFRVKVRENSLCPASSWSPTITVTVNSLDDATFTLTDYCEGSPNSATVTGTSGGVFTFTTAPTGGETINSVTGEITGGIGGTTYDVTYTTSGICPQSSTETVTVNWLPAQTIATSQTSCLGGVVPDLFAIGANVTWYDDPSLSAASQVHQGNYFATGQTAVGLYTYYVTETWNGCEGAAVPVTLEIYDSPVVTATADQTICNGYAPSSLNASIPSAGTYSWVDAADPLGIVLGTGSNFAPPPLTTTTTYTVTFTETSSGCTDNDDVTITVNPLIITPPIWHN